MNYHTKGDLEFKFKSENAQVKTERSGGISNELAVRRQQTQLLTSIYENAANLKQAFVTLYNRSLSARPAEDGQP